MNESDIRSCQTREWRRLSEAVFPANRFYRAKFDSAGLDPTSVTFENFASVPFTTKTELVRDQEEHPPFGTNLTFPIERYTRYHQTSGTTGTPLRFADTPESWDWMVDRWIEIFRAASVGPGDRVLFAFSFGPFIGFWLAFEAGTKLGALCLPAGGLSSIARLRMILGAGATVVCCTPTYALRLAEVARQEHLDISRGQVRRLIVAGEPGGSIPATRMQLEQYWPGARIFDHHGMTETGPVSFECPARPGYLHVMESGFVAEIVDPISGRAVKPGEVGELVLTNLGRTACPVIRYRTGDLVKQDQSIRNPNPPPASAEVDTPSVPVAPCACGRYDLVLEGGILGRVDDMVIIRGVNIYPTAVEHVLRGCGGIAEYQVQVSRYGPLPELKVRVEPAAPGGDVRALVGRVQKGLEQAFALRVPVEAVAPGVLPRFEMKAKRWLME